MRDGEPQLTPEQGRRGCLFFASAIAFAYLAAKLIEWAFNRLAA